jgi:hypothetical protein
LKEVEVPIKIVSVGPDRKQTILNKIKNALKFQVFNYSKPLLPYKKYLNERSTNKIKQTDLLINISSTK